LEQGKEAKIALIFDPLFGAGAAFREYLFEGSTVKDRPTKSSDKNYQNGCASDRDGLAIPLH
jgi:hypothetical protein